MVVGLAEGHLRDDQIESVETALGDGALGQMHMGDGGRIERAGIDPDAGARIVDSHRPRLASMRD